MSQARVFSIVGDSNVKRHMNPMSCRDRPMMSGAQVIQCGRAALLQASLRSVRAESDVCIVACVTNFMTSLSASGASSISLRVEPVLIDFFEKVSEASISRPDVQFFVSPPMYRTSPIWYRENLPEILKKFSDVMRSKPSSILMLPSFPTPSFETDGIHLTAYSGLEFALHLFDSVSEILTKSALDPDAKGIIVAESSRVLEDRVMVLEQDHRRLNQKFETKYAADAELSDFQENLRNESFFMVQGLRRLPKLEPKEWQERARADVLPVISLLLGRDVPISYVSNSTGRGKDSQTLYRVKVATRELSQEIRDTFGSFFLGGGDRRPPALKTISIRNCVTTATLARIAILQLLGKRYTDSNPGSKSKVIRYEPRPLLKILPSASATDKRVQSYNFIEAITKLPVCFTSSEIDELLQRISPKLYGNLQSLLVVVSDDMVKKRHQPKPKARSKSGDTSKPGATSKSPAASGRRNSKRGASASPSGSEPAAKK